MLSVSSMAQGEVEKLSREYAKLIGHQNQKQKIQHVLKIKEENNSLKLVGALFRLRDAAIVDSNVSLLNFKKKIRNTKRRTVLIVRAGGC